MNQRWRRDALLGSLFGHRGEKRKILRLDPVWMPELTSNHKLGRRALHVCACALEMARGVRQQAFDDFNTLKLAQKVRVPKVAPKFTIGDALHADVFLHFDGISDAAIFDIAQLPGPDLALLILIAGSPQLRWPKQAADVTSAKRRFLGLIHDHSLIFGVFDYSLHSTRLRHRLDCLVDETNFTSNAETQVRRDMETVLSVLCASVVSFPSRFLLARLTFTGGFHAHRADQH